MITGIKTALFGFYSAIFQPLLAQGPFISLGAIAAGLALIFSLLYYIFLDQERRDKIKEKLDKEQEKLKEAQKDEDKDASEHMKKSFELNKKFMMVNFKPSIATMVFVMLIFPWLGATYAPAIQLQPVDNSSQMFQGELSYAGQSTTINVDNTTANTTIKIDGEQYQVGDKVERYGIQWLIKDFRYNAGGITSTEGHNLKLTSEFIQLPISIPFAGDELNWLGYYIVFMMPLSIIFRKLLGVQ